MINSSVLKATRLAMPAMAAAAGYSYGESAGRADDGVKGDGAAAFQRSTKLGANYALCEKGTVLDVLNEIKRKVRQPVTHFDAKSSSVNQIEDKNICTITELLPIFSDYEYAQVDKLEEAIGIGGGGSSTTTQTTSVSGFKSDAAGAEKVLPGIDVVLGSQWGDEGKGKLVDMLSQVSYSSPGNGVNNKNLNLDLLCTLGIRCLCTRRRWLQRRSHDRGRREEVQIPPPPVGDIERQGNVCDRQRSGNTFAFVSQGN